MVYRKIWKPENLYYEAYIKMKHCMHKIENKYTLSGKKHDTGKIQRFLRKAMIHQSGVCFWVFQEENIHLKQN